MPRSYASRSSRIASSSECSPHQPVETVQSPKPTSEAAMPVDPNSRVFMLAVYVGRRRTASGGLRAQVSCAHRRAADVRAALTNLGGAPRHEGGDRAGQRLRAERADRVGLLVARP